MEFVFHSLLGESHLWLGRQGGEVICEGLAGLPEPGLLLTDARVARHQGRFQEPVLERRSLQRLVLPEGEGAKNSANLLTVLGEMAELGMERGSPLLAWGGGMVGDMGGLAAGLWKRGVPFYFVPTSLLAMVDAAVGGKTAINFADQRNSVGLFWPARRVWIDLDSLATLPEAEWSSGFGELLKAAWLSDGAWARELEQSAVSLLRWDHPALAGHIQRALDFKIQRVEEDEREAGSRALLNLGHSFAHALEAQLGEDLKHGHAVLYGMLAAARAARLAGVSDAATADEMEQRLLGVLRDLSLWPAPQLMEVPVADLLRRMAADKKVQGGRLRLVLPERPGAARLEVVDAALVERVWTEWGRMLA
jgi:3-dehydroquinate synthase